MSFSVACQLCLTGCLLSFLSFTSAHTYFSQDCSCEIQGDSDVYGIGIRVGLYLQWLTRFVTTIFEPGRTTPARTASNILILAVFINTFHTVSSESLVALD